MRSRDGYLERFGRLCFAPDGDGDGGSGGETGNTGEDGKGDGGKTADEGKGFTPPASQDDLDALIAKRLAQQERQLRKTVADDTKAALAKEQADAKAKEQGDFQRLYETEKAARETAERERDEEKRSALRARIAARHKLPDALATRLSGATEDELEADAKELAKHVKPPAAPDTEGGKGRQDSGAKPPARTQTENGKPVTTVDGQRKTAWPG